MKKHTESFDHTILLLQGGGALGAYQAGAYEGLVEAGIVPDWVVGISIGGINAALIAGNEPARRLERLHEFWDRVSMHAPLMPPSWLEPVRPMLNQMSAATAMMCGVPNFFTPREPPPSFFVPNEEPERLSYYDTQPLRDTLEELTDFKLINSRKVRLSLGAVSLSTGQSVYFDNYTAPIGPDHVRASGALPPGLPPIKVDGDYYWDGGIVSNSPLWYVLENLPRMKARVLQVDIFRPDGELPQDIDEVLRRTLDIRYSSKMPFSDSALKKVAEMKAALLRLLARLPKSMKNDPDVQKLAAIRNVGEMTVFRLTNPGLSHAGHSKDYEFSRATIRELWATGLKDVREARNAMRLIRPTEFGAIARVYDFPLRETTAKPSGNNTGAAKPAKQNKSSPRHRRSRSHRRSPRMNRPLIGRVRRRTKLVL